MLIHVTVFSIDFIGNDFYEFRSSRIMTPNTHGTGCTLASSVAAELAKGSQMLSAVKVIDLVRKLDICYFIHCCKTDCTLAQG